MGDLFHQTNAQQTATNQQIGLSTRDVGGNIITIGHGAVASGGSLSIRSLDPEALNVAAVAVHDAIAASVDANHQITEAYQRATTISGETALPQTNTPAGNPPGSGVLGLNPSQLIWIGVSVVGLIMVAGYLRHR